MDAPQKQIDFELSPETYEKLHRIAEREGKSVERCLLRMIAADKAKVELAAPPPDK